MQNKYSAAFLLWWCLRVEIRSLQAKIFYFHKTSCLSILLSGLLVFWKECFPLQDKTKLNKFKIIICCEKSVTSYNRISYKWWNETSRHPNLCHEKQTLFLLCLVNTQDIQKLCFLLCVVTQKNAVMTIASCWWLYQFFTLPFLSMGIGGHALLVFVTTLRTHLFVMKFHAYRLQYIVF